AAGAAGLLPDDTMPEWNLFILLPHRVFADPDMGHDEIDIREGFLRVRTGRKSRLWSPLFRYNATYLGYCLLTLFIFVLKLDGIDQELIKIVKQHEYDSWFQGALAILASMFCFVPCRCVIFLFLFFSVLLIRVCRLLLIAVSRIVMHLRMSLRDITLL